MRAVEERKLDYVSEEKPASIRSQRQHHSTLPLSHPTTRQRHKRYTVVAGFELSE